MTEKKGGLVDGQPRGGLADADGPGGLTAGEAGGPRPAEAGAPVTQAFRDLLMKPEEMRAANLQLSEKHFARTLSLLGLDTHRAEILAGTCPPEETGAALDAAITFFDQLARRKDHLKNQQLTQNAPQLFQWLKDLRKLRDEIKQDSVKGAQSFRTYVEGEARQSARYDARDILRKQTEIIDEISFRYWERFATRFTVLSHAELLDIAREVLGENWKPPSPTAPPATGADEVDPWIEIVQDDESYRIIGAGPPPVGERDLLRRQVADVAERVRSIKTRWEAAEKRTPALKSHRNKRSKMGKWLALVEEVAALPAGSVPERVASWVADERKRRFRGEIIDDVRRHYRDDGRIDYGEWTSLTDQSQKIIKESARGMLSAEDKATCEEWLIALCREVTKDPQWTPPTDPERALREKEKEVEREKRKSEEREKKAAAERARLTAEQERLHQERERVSLAQAEHSQQIRVLAEREHDVEQAEESLRGRDRTPPRLAVGATLGGVGGIAVALLLGAIGGHSCSAESRMSLAEARTPLIASANPETISMACASTADREARRRELAESLKSTVASIRPAAAASGVVARSGKCVAPVDEPRKP